MGFPEDMAMEEKKDDIKKMDNSLVICEKCNLLLFKRDSIEIIIPFEDWIQNKKVKGIDLMVNDYDLGLKQRNGTYKTIYYCRECGIIF